MKTIDLLYLSAQNIKTKKSRFVFTILGVSIGVGAILFLVSLGLGLQKSLHDSITTQDSLLTLDIVTSEEHIVSLNDESLARIAAIPEVELVSAQTILTSQIQISLSGRQLTSESTFNIVDENFLRLSGLLPQTGESALNIEGPNIIVNSAVAELFNIPSEQLLGQKVTFIVFIPSGNADDTGEVTPYQVKQTFTIAGIIPEASGSAGQVYVDKNYANDIPITSYQFAKVKVRASDQMELIREKLIEDGYLVSSLSDTIAQADKIFQIIQVVLGVFGVVALFVAAIGLVNTMTISLLERTQEIGIMRAIGAPPRDIQKLFLGESFLTGFLGGVFGIVIGFAGGEFFNFLVNVLARTLQGEPIDLFYYEPKFMFFIIILSSIVGLLAGLWPAHRAAKLDPIDALRYK